MDRDQGQGLDEDEEHWQRKEARRLVRDKAALNPLVLGARSGAVRLLPPDPSRFRPSDDTLTLGPPASTSFIMDAHALPLPSEFFCRPLCEKRLAVCICAMWRRLRWIQAGSMGVPVTVHPGRAGGPTDPQMAMLLDGPQPPPSPKPVVMEAGWDGVGGHARVVR